ncbi:monothiol glutaredoxin grx5 [Coelomomyces lativittatus]|nr:monothiol glutaredoxin grx5 [Coelomomyces lativittatus]
MTFPLLSSRLSSRFNLNSLCSIQLFYRSLSKETKTKIEDAIKNDICLFMKGTPEKPMCGFSQGAVRVLDCLGVQPYKSINVLEDTEIREGIKSYSDWPTIPQLYVKGQFIGGLDILLEMLRNGELQNLLIKENIIPPNDPEINPSSSK